MNRLKNIWNSANKRNAIRFVSTVAEAEKVRADDQVVICGHAVFVSLSSTGLMPDDADKYIEQTSRPVSSHFFGNKKKRRFVTRMGI